MVGLSRGMQYAKHTSNYLYVKCIFLNFSRSTNCIIVNPDNEHYCSIDGTLFTKNKTRLLVYPQYKKDSEYTVLERVLEIDNTFRFNEFCKVIKLPTTLREFHSKYGTNFEYVEKFIIPEVNFFFRFYGICLPNVQHLKIPASIMILPFNSFSVHGAVVDATEVQCFMKGCIICKELYISEKMEFVDTGAFCNVEVLHTPEHKIFNFVKTLFLVGDAKISVQLHYRYSCCVIVTLESGKLLYLKIPNFDNPSESAYSETIESFWSIDRISVDKYINAIIQLNTPAVKCDALCYFIEKNAELGDLLFSAISKFADRIVPLLIENEKFNTISVLCKNDLLTSSEIRKLLQKDLSNQLIPVFMSALQGSESINLDL